MACELKTTIKLKSNIIRKDKPIGFYIPVEFKPREAFDTRVIEQQMSQAQRQQVLKKLFFAERIVDADKRYSEEKVNKEICSDCPYKDICV